MLYIFGKLILNAVQWPCKNVTCQMYYISHVTNVTCHKYQVSKNFTKYPMCFIFLKSWCKIQFSGHAKMSDVTCVTCHISQVLLAINVKDPMCYIYLESWCKHLFNGHDKKHHVTCDTCHVQQMLHDTNIKLPRMQNPVQWPCKKSPVTCQICYNITNIS